MRQQIDIVPLSLCVDSVKQGSYISPTDRLRDFDKETSISQGKGTRVFLRAQNLSESRGGRPGLPVPNKPYGLCGRKATVNSNHHLSELRSCVKVEVAVLRAHSLIAEMVSVDVKQH